MQDNWSSTFQEPRMIFQGQETQSIADCDYFHCPFSGTIFLVHKEDSDSPSRPTLYDDIPDVMDDSLDDSELDDVMPQVAEAKVQPSNRDDTASSCSDSDQAGTTSMEKDSSADLETKPDPQASRASPSEKSVTVHSRRLTSSSVQPVQITAELLAEHFHESLEVAASKIGIGKSTMKIVCRRLGIEKWPYVHTGSRRRRGRAGQEKAKKGESEGEGVDRRTSLLVVPSYSDLLASRAANDCCGLLSSLPHQPFMFNARHVENV